MKNILIFFLSLLCLQANAQVNSKNLRIDPKNPQPEVIQPNLQVEVTAPKNDLQIEQENRKALAQAYEFYKKEAFESSIAVLQKVKTNTSLMQSIYYLLGLNYYRSNNFDLAEKYLSEVTRTNTIQEISLAYYYLGLAQFQKGDYERAMNSFELSIDTSKDPEHDKRSERMIEKCIQVQAQIESDKLKYTMGFTAGYMYDSNALNVAPGQDVIIGHVLSASGFFSFKFWQDKKSSVEPMIYLADQRTLDYKLKFTDQIQAADSTMLLTSIPYKTVVDDYRSTTSMNLGLYMLPTDSQIRDMSIALIYVKQNLGTHLSADMDLDGQLIIGRDDSQITFADAADNQTAIKYDLSGALKYSLFNVQSITGQLGFILNDADGENASYNKIYANISYELPTFKNTLSTFKVSYGSTNYSLSELARRDSFTAANYSIIKDLTERTTINGFLGVSRNESTIEDYTYGDATIGLQYVYFTRF